VRSNGALMTEVHQMIRVELFYSIFVLNLRCVLLLLSNLSLQSADSWHFQCVEF